MNSTLRGVVRSLDGKRSRLACACATTGSFQLALRPAWLRRGDRGRRLLHATSSRASGAERRRRSSEDALTAQSRGETVGRIVDGFDALRSQLAAKLVHLMYFTPESGVVGRIYFLSRLNRELIVLCESR